MGEPSKIREEFEEFEDAIAQDNLIMAIMELSDMLGAMELYLQTYNLELVDLIIMKDKTKETFISGRR